MATLIYILSGIIPGLVGFLIGIASLALAVAIRGKPIWL